MEEADEGQMMFSDAANPPSEALISFRNPIPATPHAFLPPRLKAAGRDSAHCGRYISGAAWQTDRLCFASAENARIDVQHRTYRNFGCERAEDLTEACDVLPGPNLLLSLRHPRKGTTRD
ncbi:hypothetical protein XI06_27175 [Bradyrhizobium sp. CCBAU 11434]|uniref:hypothetical protein n=1 Tax=Bradyrhizobium sp. CCBAU 11434 TaxID=1630885 RepID=UPI0023056672|nr:hypothetical protein [Bradyrhizobium sp. CCBAU 11434]MDA9523860.1 hypothetical protein [Bradyrhizobium sp. CCBAU 11434]